MCKSSCLAAFEQTLYPAILSFQYCSIILPHLSLVVHSTYAVEFTLNSSAVFRPDMRFQLHVQRRSYRNTSFGVCLVLCFFGGSKLSSLGFFVWYLCCYPKKIVYSHVSPVQFRRCGGHGMRYLSCDLSICQSLATLGNTVVMAASLPGITYSNDVILPVYHHGRVYCKHFALARVLSLLLVFVFGRVVSTSEPSMVISPPSLPGTISLNSSSDFIVAMYFVSLSTSLHIAHHRTCLQA